MLVFGDYWWIDTRVVGSDCGGAQSNWWAVIRFQPRLSVGFEQINMAAYERANTANLQPTPW